VSAPRRLRAGVIAAGRGDRLRNAAATLKPLVRVGGRPLIDRVIESIEEAGASEVCIIINEDSLAVRDHVSAVRRSLSVRWLVESTPSSMHSFLRVLETLAEENDPTPVLISTVDTVAPPGAFRSFLADAARVTERPPKGRDDAWNPAVVLAVTTVTDDEKPLLVKMDGDAVVALGDAAAASSAATAGYYLVSPVVLHEADAARREGVSALRAFFGRLLARGYPMAGVSVPQSIDVDRPEDVDAAEDLLKRVSL
jgi:choline kinase